MTLLLAKSGAVPRGAAFQAARRLGLPEFEWKDPASGKVGRFHTRMAGEGIKLPRGMKESDLYRDAGQERINRDYYDTTQRIEKDYQQKLADIRSKYALKDLAFQEERERQAESEGESEYLRETAEPSDRAKINQLRRAKAQAEQEDLERQEEFEGRSERLGGMQNQLEAMNRQIEVLRTRPEDLASDRAKIAATQRAFQQWADQKKKEQALQGVYPEAAIPFLRGLGALFRSSRTQPMQYYSRQEPTFAAGGLAGLANQGRRGDTMLVHMSPDEVRNMQQMALARGTTMTINPETGLPEAFKLRKLLRGLAAIAPIAAAFFPPLAAAMPFLTTPMGAALAGGVSGGLSGDKGFDLKRGITSGLLSYGIGSAMKGLEAAGATGSAAASGADTAAQLASQEAIASAVPEAVPGFMTNPAPGTDPIAAAAGQSAAQSAASIAAPAALTPAEAAAFDLAGSGPAAVQGSAASGLSALVDPATTDAAQQAFMSQFGKGAMYATGAGLIGTMALDEQEKAAKAALAAGRMSQQQYQEFMDRLNQAKARAEYAIRKNPYKFALGGEIDDRYQLMTPEFGGKPSPEKNVFGLAKGGIASLPPRYLSGGGDGMSDSIPAVIGNKQPARLADGEFVIPADVVSHLGNGSSKAGAKQLYAMMDRVRRARTGSDRQGRQINAANMMPA